MQLRNLLRTSVAAAKRVFQLNPPTEQPLLTFNTQSDLAAWRPYSDRDYGGLSTSNFELTGEKKGAFYGDISVELDPEQVVQIKKSGFAGLITKREYGVFDLTPYDSIQMHLKGDGRSYLTSLRTENWVDRPFADDNTWHHIIHTTKDEWKVYKLSIRDYKRTWHGRIVQEQAAINTSRVVGLGFHVTARLQQGLVQGTGPYRLELDWIRAIRTKDFYRQG